MIKPLHNAYLNRYNEQFNKRCNQINDYDIFITDINHLNLNGKYNRISAWSSIKNDKIENAQFEEEMHRARMGGEL